MAGQSENASSDTLIDETQQRVVLGIDTCGATGSVALVRVSGSNVAVVGETALEGRTYSATLVSAIAELVRNHQLALGDVDCMVVVSGPGSFTGVRVGLSAAKGLAEGAGMPLIAVSRLAVLAAKAGVPNAALDAHRHEVFLRLGEREVLAGAADVAGETAPPSVAVTDEAAERLLLSAWPTTAIFRVEALTAADAIRLALPRISAHGYDDAALLDGHYLRRSDAEIFGESAGRP